MIDHLDHTLWKHPETPEPVLKPCPFCGSNKSRIFTLTPEAWVRCDACLATGGDKRSTEEALAAWNAAPRPEENDALKVRVAELEAALRLLARRPPGLGVFKDNELISTHLLVGDIRHAVAVLERSKPCEH